MIQMEPKQPGERYTFQELYHIIELLRSPEGCPWDREQTHESLIKPMLEEAYEAVDAIEKKSPEKLCEELGDVLLQVIFHTILAKEEGSFAFEDVTDRCARKMLFRHKRPPKSHPMFWKSFRNGKTYHENYAPFSRKSQCIRNSLERLDPVFVPTAKREVGINGIHTNLPHRHKS